MDEVLAYVAELVAFAIIIFFVVRYIVPPARKAMQAQQEKIRLQIERAAETEKRLAVAETKLAEAQVEARQEAAKIRDNARADAQRIGEEMRAQAGPMLGMLSQMGGMAFGSQLGAALSQLAGEVLTSTDIGLPLAPAGTAALMPRAVAEFGTSLGRGRLGAFLHFDEEWVGVGLGDQADHHAVGTPASVRPFVGGTRVVVGAARGEH